MTDNNFSLNSLATKDDALRFVGDWAKLAEALAKAQGKFAILTRATVGRVSASHTFKFADMDVHIRSIRAALSEHGIAVLQAWHEAGAQDAITTILAGHGGRIESRISFVPAKDPKQQGALLTYFARYALNKLFVLGGGEDADESVEHIEQAPRERTEAQRESKDAPMMTVEQSMEVFELFKKLDIPREDIDPLLMDVVGTTNRKEITETQAQDLLKALRLEDADEDA